MNFSIPAIASLASGSIFLVLVLFRYQQPHEDRHESMTPLDVSSSSIAAVVESPLGSEEGHIPSSLLSDDHGGTVGIRGADLWPSDVNDAYSYHNSSSPDFDHLQADSAPGIETMVGIDNYYNDHRQLVFASCDGKVCGSGSRCKASFLSFAATCVALKENGKRCADDNDCASGRCTLGRKCRDKIPDNFGICSRDNDCENGWCNNVGMCGKSKLGARCHKSEDCESGNCQKKVNFATVIQGTVAECISDELAEAYKACWEQDGGCSATFSSEVNNAYTNYKQQIQTPEKVAKAGMDLLPTLTDLLQAATENSRSEYQKLVDAAWDHNEFRAIEALTTLLGTIDQTELKNALIDIKENQDAVFQSLLFQFGIEASIDGPPVQSLNIGASTSMFAGLAVSIDWLLFGMGYYEGIHSDLDSLLGDAPAFSIYDGSNGEVTLEVGILGPSSTSPIGIDYVYSVAVTTLLPHRYFGVLWTIGAAAEAGFKEYGFVLYYDWTQVIDFTAGTVGSSLDPPCVSVASVITNSPGDLIDFNANIASAEVSAGIVDAGVAAVMCPKRRPSTWPWEYGAAFFQQAKYMISPKTSAGTDGCDAWEPLPVEEFETCFYLGDNPQDIRWSIRRLDDLEIVAIYDATFRSKDVWYCDRFELDPTKYVFTIFDKQESGGILNDISVKFSLIGDSGVQKTVLEIDGEFPTAQYFPFQILSFDERQSLMAMQPAIQHAHKVLVCVRYPDLQEETDPIKWSLKHHGQGTYYGDAKILVQAPANKAAGSIECVDVPMNLHDDDYNLFYFTIFGADKPVMINIQKIHPYGWTQTLVNVIKAYPTLTRIPFQVIPPGGTARGPYGLLRIYVGDHPEDLRWSVKDINGLVIHQRPSYSSWGKNQWYSFGMTLPNNILEPEEYVFRIFDGNKNNGIENVVVRMYIDTNGKASIDGVKVFSYDGDLASMKTFTFSTEILI